MQKLPARFAVLAGLNGSTEIAHEFKQEERTNQK